MSSKILEENVISLLQKGPNFSLPLYHNPAVFKYDSLLVCRSLRFKEFFAHNTSYSPDPSPFIYHTPTHASPPETQNKAFDHLVSQIEERTFEKHDSHPVYTAKNIKVLRLLKDKSISICKADKGGCTVILDKSDYFKLQEVHLNDHSTYKKLASPSNEIIGNKIKDLVDHHKEELLLDERNFLLDHSGCNSKFYVLPKIHKSDVINNAIAENSTQYLNLGHMPNDIKSRPIVNNINSPTCRLSYFLDKVLKPLVSIVPGYIKDSFDFIQKLPKALPSNAIFITLDVCSLYTIIPHEFGLEAITYYTTKYRRLLPSRISQSFIIESLGLILKNNIFSRGKDFYHQISGTAMGTIVAPTYAHLVMGYVETMLHEKCEKQFGAANTKSIMELYKRFLDDIFLIWYPDFGDHLSFISLINNIHPSFKFTHTIDMNQCNFLDIHLRKQGTSILLDIYRKNTDSQLYLHFHSSHPSKVKRNIPYTLAFRICRIVSSSEIRKHRLNELRSILLSLCYPISLVENSINKALNTQINTRASNTSNNSVIPVILDYHPKNAQISSQELIPHLRNITTSFLPQNTIIQAYRQPHKLSRLTNSTVFFNTTRCNKPRCKLCPDFIESRKSIFINGKPILFNSNMCCVTSNLIYCLFCKKCPNQFYIGETSLPLSNRITLHRQQSTHSIYTILPVSKHLLNCKSGFLVTPLFHLPNRSQYLRRKMEQYFINILNPTLNA